MNAMSQVGDNRSALEKRDHVPISSPLLKGERTRSEVVEDNQDFGVAVKRMSEYEESLMEELTQEIAQELSSFATLNFTMDPEKKRLSVRVVEMGDDDASDRISSEHVKGLISRVRNLDGLLFNADA